jgi:hypothetical protein
MILFLWAVGYLFTVGLLINYIRFLKWYIILLLIFWPFFLGYILRNLMENPMENR